MKLGTDILLEITEVLLAEDKTRNYIISLKDTIHNDTLDCETVTMKLTKKLPKNFYKTINTAVAKFKDEIYDVWGEF